ncbi:MAG: PLP-dependent transferase [Dehalococcoidia bacterium]
MLRDYGGVISAMSAFVCRGIPTLALRMERHCDNAERVASFLASHPAVQ